MVKTGRASKYESYRRAIPAMAAISRRKTMRCSRGYGLLEHRIDTGGKIEWTDNVSANIVAIHSFHKAQSQLGDFGNHRCLDVGFDVRADVV